MDGNVANNQRSLVETAPVVNCHQIHRSADFMDLEAFPPPIAGILLRDGRRGFLIRNK